MDSHATYESREASNAGSGSQPDGYLTRYDTSESSYKRQEVAGDASRLEMSEVSPTSRAVVAAFQAFGRRRGTTLEGSADDEYQLAKEREMEIQKARQKRIRDKVPGRKATGKTRIGDIDGRLIFDSPTFSASH